MTRRILYLLEDHILPVLAWWFVLCVLVGGVGGFLIWLGGGLP